MVERGSSGVRIVVSPNGDSDMGQLERASFAVVAPTCGAWHHPAKQLG